MLTVSPDTQKYLRTLLALARASNLPTVWSNCLAGWLIAGGGPLTKFLLLCVAATCLYIGGMYLNDAFDVEFDRLNRKERPIPSGAISEADVWGYGFSWLGLGLALMYFFSGTTFVLALALIGSILLYDATHKAVAFSPVLMAFCRFFLFVLAASVGRGGSDGAFGLSIWTACALFCYIVGLSYVARNESNRGQVPLGPLALLLAPIGLAWLVNAGEFSKLSLFYSAILLGWILWSLSHTFWRTERNVGRTVSGLLAGIVLVDLLATTGASPWIALTFAVLFGASLLFQRFIPAT